MAWGGLIGSALAGEPLLVSGGSAGKPKDREARACCCLLDIGAKVGTTIRRVGRVSGSGCPRCKRLEQITREAGAEADIEINLTKVTDMEGIIAYPIVRTPGLVIDQELVSSGRLPRKEKIVAWLKEAQA